MIGLAVKIISAHPCYHHTIGTWSIIEYYDSYNDIYRLENGCWYALDDLEFL